MKKAKKLLVMVLTVCMSIMCCSIPTFATSVQPSDTTPIIFDASDGTIEVAQVSSDYVTNESEHRFNLVGKSMNAKTIGQQLEEQNYKQLKDPIYWCDREFVGWRRVTDAFPFDDDTIISTEEIMNMTVPDDKEGLSFKAVWAGKNSDYYSQVEFITNSDARLVYEDGISDVFGIGYGYKKMDQLLENSLNRKTQEY